MLACVAGCGGGSSDSATTATPHVTPVKTLRGPGFKTSVPAGWHERRLHGKGDDAYFSGLAKAPSNLEIAPGGIGLTIAVQPASQAHDPKSAVAAVKTDVGTPREATGVALMKPATPTRLAGADAATLQFGYRYHDAADTQTSMIALHGGRLIFVELNAPPDLQPLALRVLARLMHDWRWLRTGTGPGQPSV